MANGIKALRQIQMSRETTQGTPTTDFTVWRGVGTIQDMRETVFAEEDIGIFGGTTRNYTPMTKAEMVFDETPATFEQLFYIFDAGIYEVTATTDTSSTDPSSAKIRTYTLPLTQTQLKSSSDLQTYSMKVGDNNEVEKSAFMFVREFELAGTAGEAWNITATWDGRQVYSDTDGFATATIQAVEEILFSKTKLFIDDNDTDFGVTEISNTLLSATLSVTGLWMSKETANGRLDYSLVKMVQPEIMLEVTFEHDGSASAEKAHWRNGTTRLIQLYAKGSALSDTGTSATYDTKAMVLNLAGKWDNFDKLDEQDGNDIVTGTFRVRYDTTAAKYAQMIVVNEVA